MITRKPDHLKSFDYIGPHRYFLTFCTYERHQAFVIREQVDLVRDQILRTSSDLGFALTAYCFMPDHVHLLAEGLDDASNGLAFISRSKQFSGYYYARLTGRRLWQRYGYERTLRHEEAALSVARYIVENPLRAGLVQRAEDYPFLGSSCYTIEQLLDAVQTAPTWSRRGQLKPDVTYRSG